MTRRFRGPISSVLMVFIFLSFTVNVFPADPENKVAGRIYDLDHDKGLPDATVRIVEMNSGVAYADTTDKSGCYEFENAPVGNYSVTVSHQGKDYLYPDKLQIIQTKSEKNLFKRCYGLNNDGSLMLMPDKECDLCKRFPLAYLVVGVGAGVAAALLIGDDDDDVASPSNP